MDAGAGDWTAPGLAHLGSAHGASAFYPQPSAETLEHMGDHTGS